MNVAQSVQKLDWGHWLLGLMAATITGAAGGITAGLSAMGALPQQVNLQNGLHPLLVIAFTTALVSGILGAAAFLKQSPVPREIWSDQQRQQAAESKTEDAHAPT